MNNIQYDNKEIKKFYNSLTITNNGLNGVMLVLLQRSNVIIRDIITNPNNVQIIANLGKELINIQIDFYKNKIYVISPGKSCKEIYDNFPKKHLVPIGYEYQNKERKIIKQNIFEYLDDGINRHYFDIKDNDKGYNVLIKDSNNTFQEDVFINKVLHFGVPFTTIRDLLMIILNNIKTYSLDISICDSKGSNILIEHGCITKYIEYFDINGEYQKLYLEDGNFYLERKVKEEYQDNLTAYVKRVGESYGKEKR